MLMHHKFWPQYTPVYCGSADKGAYDVHPAAAWPKGTKKPASMSTPATAPTQKEIIFRTGNAMSRVPIISGMRKFPKHPTRMGITTKKIMMVACMVNSAL